MTTITLNFSDSLVGVNFDANTATSVAQLLVASPNAVISIGTTLTGDNLTSEGLLPGGTTTAWRITNAGVAANATLSRVGGGFSKIFALPENSITFVAGGAAGTYQLSGDIVNTKASGTQSNQIFVFAAGSSYNITGSAFADSLLGGTGTDSIFGGDGNDTLWGRGGNDTLIGGNGNDFLVGNNNADRFVFTNQGVDRVSQFSAMVGGSGSDVFAITSSAYTGAPAPGAAVVSTTPLDGQANNVIFVASLGVIQTTVTSGSARFALATPISGARQFLYDADGNWSGLSDQVVIATVDGISGTLGSANFAFI